MQWIYDKNKKLFQCFNCLFLGASSAGEEDVWSAWGSIVSDWEAAQKRKNPSVKDLIRRSIPHHFRAIVWQLLCNAADTDKKQYAEYIKATSACEKVIRRDVARTYPEHEFFKEKEGQVGMRWKTDWFCLNSVLFFTIIGGVIQCHQSVFVTWSWSWILPRVWFHRRPITYANAWRGCVCSDCSNNAGT